MLNAESALGKTPLSVIVLIECIDFHDIAGGARIADSVRGSSY